MVSNECFVFGFLVIVVPSSVPPLPERGCRLRRGSGSRLSLSYSLGLRPLAPSAYSLSSGLRPPPLGQRRSSARTIGLVKRESSVPPLPVGCGGAKNGHACVGSRGGGMPVDGCPSFA